MATNLGDVKLRKQTTCRVYMKRTGASEFYELGNVDKYSRPDERSYADIVQSRKGFKQTTAKNLAKVGLYWKFTCDEQIDEWQKLLGLATKGADTVQSAATGQSNSLTGVKLGATYFLTKKNVSNVVITGKTAGVDYDIEPGSGALTILATGTIADGANVSVAFDCGAVTVANFTTLKDPRVTGAFIVQEYDQHSDVPRETHSFNGQIWVSNQPDSSGEAPSQIEYTVLVTDQNPASQKRVD